MSLRLAPYPEYKDSGLPWLGGIPRHWHIGPGFAAFREKQFKNTGMKEKTVLSLSYGRIVVKPAERLHGLVPLSFETYQIVNPGDIIIRSTDLQNDWNSLRIGLVRDRGIITSAYLCFATTGALVPEYGYLLLHAFDLMKVFYGMGSGLRQNLDFSDFKRMVIFIPPSEEQAAIVRFLDHADRRVRRFVAAKRRLIELLNEQRQATIQRAVTRGLNPSVRFKTSGIDWLPAIPVHWSAMRLGSIAETLQTGPFGSQLHASDYQPNGTPVINPCHMDEGRLSPDRACAVGASKAAELRRHRLQSGDIVFARRGELGRCALVTPQEEGWLCGTGSLRMRTRGDLADPQFLVRLLLSKGVAQWLSLQSIGATMENLNPGILSRLPLPLPPRAEQRAILAYITERRAGLDNALQVVHSEIDLVREYHTRLIADVVTGKLDVRGAELPQLHEAEELPPVDDGIADDATEQEDESEPVGGK